MKDPTPLTIDPETRVSTLLDHYGDIAPEMQALGISAKTIPPYSVRRLLAKLLTVRTAAKFHGVDLEPFLETLNKALAARRERGEGTSVDDHVDP